MHFIMYLLAYVKFHVAIAARYIYVIVRPSACIVVAVATNEAQ
jgi:hypothetical protein